MLKGKQEMIDLLTGVKSSKQNYYTELKKTNIQLKKKNVKLEIINDVMKSFNVNMAMDDMLKNTLEKLKELYAFYRVSLSLYEGDQLILASVFPANSFFVKVGEPLSRQYSTYWNVIEQKEAIIIKSPKHSKITSSIEKETFEKLKIQNVFLFPLISKKKVIGVLSCGSKQVIECDESDIIFLQQLADQLAVCIENSRLYNEVLRGKKEWEETFRAVLDMIILVDMNDRILRFNHSVNKFFGLSDKLLYGKKCTELLIDHLTSEKKHLIDDNFLTTAYTQMHFNNNRICDVYTYPVFNDSNEMYGVILYMKDVTEKLHTEVQLIQSSKLAALGEMAAGVAHELNSPLTAILGNSQLLLREITKTDPFYKLLEDIKNCGDRCKNIIRNLLTFSRQDTYLPKECFVNEAVKQVLSLVGYQIERQNIKILTELDDNIPAIEGDLQQIEQIVVNFVLNAKDALEACTYKEKKILIQTKTLEANGKALVSLAVTDNGSGIKDSDISEVFRPFFTTKQQRKGTGLGLSVSLGIAKTHGGTIEVKSKVGKGSTFTLLLPVFSQDNIE